MSEEIDSPKSGIYINDLIYKASVIAFHPLRQIKCGFAIPHEKVMESINGGCICLDRHNHDFNESYDVPQYVVSKIEKVLGIKILNVTETY
jgi:hypothetical protein